jgi:hypothetical protein
MLAPDSMRSVIAVLVGAAAVGVYLGQTRSGVLRPQASTPALLDAAIQFGLLALIAFLIGFVVRRRGWLSALAAYLIGLAIWVVVELRPSPPWVPTDVGGVWEAIGLRAIIGGVWSALSGAAGSWAARARERASTRVS